MKLKQTLPYKLKRVVPILGLAGASLFTACHQEPIIQHDTIYTWDRREYYKIGHASFGYADSALSTLPQRVRASADSPQVRNVFLRFENKPAEMMPHEWFVLDMDMRDRIEDSILAPIPQQNRYKVRGMDTIKRLVIWEPADSAWLADFGYILTETFTPEEVVFHKKQHQK